MKFEERKAFQLEDFAHFPIRRLCQGECLGASRFRLSASRGILRFALPAFCQCEVFVRCAFVLEGGWGMVGAGLKDFELNVTVA